MKAVTPDLDPTLSLILTHESWLSLLSLTGWLKDLFPTKSCKWPAAMNTVWLSLQVLHCIPSFQSSVNRNQRMVKGRSHYSRPWTTQTSVIPKYCPIPCIMLISRSASREVDALMWSTNNYSVISHRVHGLSSSESEVWASPFQILSSYVLGIIRCIYTDLLRSRSPSPWPHFKSPSLLKCTLAYIPQCTLYLNVFIIGRLGETGTYFAWAISGCLYQKWSILFLSTVVTVVKFMPCWCSLQQAMHLLSSLLLWSRGSRGNTFGWNSLL